MSRPSVSRPLSPHLGIYKFAITMAMSIMHRITGSALYFGMAILAWWLLAVAIGPAHFAFVEGLLTSILGILVMIGFTWALLHHMFGGIRHLIWDTGAGLGPSSRFAIAWATLIGSLGLTALIWLSGLLM